MFSIKKVQIVFKNICKLRTISTTAFRNSNDVTNESIEEILTTESDYNREVEHFMSIKDVHNCLVIQPYVKWGPRKLPITPEEQLEEAIALVNTLPSWKVVDTVKVPLESLDSKTLFKSGNMERLSKMVRKDSEISAVFINTSNLKIVTARLLQENFRLPILDRYRIVIQILKIHATSKYAKLQVALAELYFIRRKAETNQVFVTQDRDVLKLMFQNREQKLKKAISSLREQRKLLRSKRRKLEYPVVAVIGYTNAGKTCLIKALTGEDSLQPRDQLFATLDVTVHSGLLPSGLKTLYVDTVGFLSDIPTDLIECFIATLEDAILADVIVHVEDLSSSCFDYKREHVLKTIRELGRDAGSDDIMDKVMSVGNKCDVVKEVKDQSMLLVSAKLGTGLDQLRYNIEKAIMTATDRHYITIKVPNGGEELRWLHKEATIVSQHPEETNSQVMKTKVIITNVKLKKFKHLFLSKSK